MFKLQNKFVLMCNTGQKNVLGEICMQVRKQQLELDMEQHTGSK